MKNMKKILMLAVALSVLCALMCLNAFAAEIGTITDKAAGVSADIVTKEVNGENLKVAVDFEYTGVTKDNMYLVLVLKEEADGSVPTRPTNSNILYVNQATAESDTITFDNLYPSEVKESYIFLAGADVDYSKPLAKINPLKPDGLLGDVNMDGVVNSDDAVAILRHIVLLETTYYEEYADFNQDGKKNSDDAVAILRWCIDLDY